MHTLTRIDVTSQCVHTISRISSKSLVGMLFIICMTVFENRGMSYPCGFPGRPRNGSSLMASAVSRAGDTVQYSCQHGFTLFGDKERVCLESGIWAGRQPICELNLALKRPALISTQLWNYKPDLAVDGNLETCSFTPRTSEQRWWQVDLTQDQHIGSVTLVISQDSYHELTIFIVELVSRSEALYKPCTHFKGRFPESKMHFFCNKGKGHSGRYVYVRDDRKDYDYFGLCEVEVFAYTEVAACGDPEEAVASTVEILGDTAMYSCLPGYLLVGLPNRTCEKGGHWTGHSPQCSVIFCGQPPQIAHAEMELANRSTKWSSVAIYTCKAGYSSHQGSQWSIHCTDDGYWNEVNVTCLPDVNSRQQLAVKSREKVFSELEYPVHKINHHTALSAGIVSSVMLTIIALIGVVLIRRHQADQFPLPQTSTNGLVTDPGKSNRNEFGALSTGSSSESTVLCTADETSRKRLSEENTIGAKSEKSPEILAPYPDVDASKKIHAIESEREPCHISKDSECVSYNLEDNVTRNSKSPSSSRQSKFTVPQVCLLRTLQHPLFSTSDRS